MSLRIASYSMSSWLKVRIVWEKQSKENYTVNLNIIMICFFNKRKKCTSTLRNLEVGSDFESTDQ